MPKNNNKRSHSPDRNERDSKRSRTNDNDSSRRNRSRSRSRDRSFNEKREAHGHYQKPSKSEDTSYHSSHRSREDRFGNDNTIKEARVKVSEEILATYPIAKEFYNSFPHLKVDYQGLHSEYAELDVLSYGLSLVLEKNDRAEIKKYAQDIPHLVLGLKVTNPVLKLVNPYISYFVSIIQLIRNDISVGTVYNEWSKAANHLLGIISDLINRNITTSNYRDIKLKLLLKYTITLMLEEMLDQIQLKNVINICEKVISLDDNLLSDKAIHVLLRIIFKSKPNADDFNKVFNPELFSRALKILPTERYLKLFIDMSKFPANTIGSYISEFLDLYPKAALSHAIENISLIDAESMLGIVFSNVLFKNWKSHRDQFADIYAHFYNPALKMVLDNQDKYLKSNFGESDWFLKFVNTILKISKDPILLSKVSPDLLYDFFKMLNSCEDKEVSVNVFRMGVEIQKNPIHKKAISDNSLIKALSRIVTMDPACISYRFVKIIEKIAESNSAYEILSPSIFRELLIKAMVNLGEGETYNLFQDLKFFVTYVPDLVRDITPEDIERLIYVSREHIISSLENKIIFLDLVVALIFNQDEYELPLTSKSIEFIKKIIVEVEPSVFTQATKMLYVLTPLLKIPAFKKIITSEMIVNNFVMKVKADDDKYKMSLLINTIKEISFRAHYLLENIPPEIAADFFKYSLAGINQFRKKEDRVSPLNKILSLLISFTQTPWLLSNLTTQFYSDLNKEILIDARFSLVATQYFKHLSLIAKKNELQHLIDSIKKIDISPIIEFTLAQEYDYLNDVNVLKHLLTLKKNLPDLIPARYNDQIIGYTWRIISNESIKNQRNNVFKKINIVVNCHKLLNVSLNNQDIINFIDKKLRMLTNMQMFVNLDLDKYFHRIAYVVYLATQKVFDENLILKSLNLMMSRVFFRKLRKDNFKMIIDLLALLPLEYSDTKNYLGSIFHNLKTSLHHRPFETEILSQCLLLPCFKKFNISSQVSHDTVPVLNEPMEICDENDDIIDLNISALDISNDNNVATVDISTKEQNLLTETEDYKNLDLSSSFIIGDSSVSISPCQQQAPRFYFLNETDMADLSKVCSKEFSVNCHLNGIQKFYFNKLYITELYALGSGGYGLFTAKDISFNANQKPLGIYTGDVVANPDSQYLFQAIGENDVSVEYDAEKNRNPSAFINHSQYGNAIARTKMIKNQPVISMALVVNLKENDQILFPYGPNYYSQLDYDPYYLHPTDGWKSDHKVYDENKIHYCGRYATVQGKIQSILKLPKAANWLVPKLFVAINNNDRLAIETNKDPIDLYAYAVRDNEFLKINEQPHLTPLMYAAVLANVDMINALLAKGADPDRALFVEGYTPLTLLLKSEQSLENIENCAITLLNHMRFPFLEDKYQLHVLHYAILRNSPGLVKTILKIAIEEGMDIFSIISNRKPTSADFADFDYCLLNNQNELLEMLLTSAFQHSELCKSNFINLIRENKIFRPDTLNNSSIEQLKRLKFMIENICSMQKYRFFKLEFVKKIEAVMSLKQLQQDPTSVCVASTEMNTINPIVRKMKDRSKLGVKKDTVISPRIIENNTNLLFQNNQPTPVEQPVDMPTKDEFYRICNLLSSYLGLSSVIDLLINHIIDRLQNAIPRNDLALLVTLVQSLYIKAIAYDELNNISCGGLIKQYENFCAINKSYLKSDHQVSALPSRVKEYKSVLAKVKPEVFFKDLIEKFYDRTLINDTENTKNLYAQLSKNLNVLRKFTAL